MIKKKTFINIENDRYLNIKESGLKSMNILLQQTQIADYQYYNKFF